MTVKPRRSRMGVLVVICCLLPALDSAPAEASERDLIDLPELVLDGMEPPVREELERRAQDLDRLLEAYSSAQDGAAQDGASQDRASPELGARLAQAFGEAGLIYHGFDLEDAAAACYRNAAVLAPSEPRWPYLAAVSAVGNRDLETASRFLQEVLALRPDHLPSKLRSAEILRLQGKGEEAAAIWRRILDDPIATTSPGAVGSAHLGLGRLANAGGDAEAAVRHLEAVTELHPEAGAAHQQLALAYRRLGRLDAARGAAAKAGSSVPTFADPWLAGVRAGRGATARLLLGNAEFRAGRLSTALEHHREARRLGPDDPAAARALALTLESSGRLDEAIELYGEAVTLSSGDPLYLYDHARARLKRDRADAGAVEQLRRVVAQAPDHLSAHLLLASTLTEPSEAGEAESLLRRALELSPGEPRAERALAGLRMAAAYSASGSIPLADAVEALEEAAELLPSGAPEAQAVGLDLSRMLLQVGREADAAEHLERLAGSSLAATWLAVEFWAGASDPSLRDPRRAVETARRTFEMKPSPEGAELMAFALASAGAFEVAVEWQQRLLDQVAGLGAPAVTLDRLRSNLALYRASRPGRPSWHSPPPGEDPP